MNKILIPTILAATVLIAGIFAFMPVEKASTIHGLIGGTASILTTTMTLPQNNVDILLVIDCGPKGGTVLDIFHDNSPTTGPQKDYELRDIDVSFDGTQDQDRSYRQQLGLTFAGLDNTAYRSLWDQLWDVGKTGFHHFNGIVCPPGEFIVMEWATRNENNDVIVDIYVAFSGDLSASVSTTPL